MRIRKAPKQLELEIKAWGGSRKGAGRKRTKTSLQRHGKREIIKPSYPGHVTLTFERKLDTIRHKRAVLVFAKAARKAQGFGLKIIHFSLQHDHAHLIVEAKKNADLSKGLQSFSISMAKTLNGLFHRKGKVFRDRYHLRVLKTPTEVKNAIRYALFNRAKHLEMKAFVDRYSSVAYGSKESLREFTKSLKLKVPIPDWLGAWRDEIDGALSPANSWLLREGWRRGI